MTGFAGFVDGARGAPDRATLDRMLESMRHRGSPSGVGVSGPIALGSVGEGGGSFPEGNPIWAAIDGRFSAPDRPGGQLLEQRRERRGPADLLREAHAAWGADLLDHLSGGFAFALWNETSSTLILARDHAGVRPLYYSHMGKDLCFASEIRALLQHPRVPRAVHAEVVPEYLAYRYASGGATLFRGIQELEPGWCLTWEAGIVRLERYWDLPYEFASDEFHHATDYVQRIDAALTEAIRTLFREKARIGVLLSGGLDSSLLTALAVRVSSSKLRTFSVGVDDARFDETPRAETVARALGTEHASRRVSARGYAAALPAAIAANEEPLHHPNSVALHIVAQEAAREVDGLVMGEGADSSFGNRTAQKLQLAEGLRALLPRRLLLQGCNALGAVGLDTFRKLHAVLAADAERFSLTANLFASISGVCDLAGLADEEPILAPRRRFFEGHGEWPALAALLYYYQKTEMVASFNVFGKMLSSAGVEGLMPFGERSVQELSCRIPIAFKARLGQAKPLLARTARRHLPAKVVAWPKLSFGFPIGDWFRRSEALAPYAGLLTQSRTLDRGLLRPGAVSRVLAEHASGRLDHGEGLLWTAVNLELWARIHVDGTPMDSILADARREGLRAGADR
jgi:asparagine synthase (glutamine-hydrolysing)